MENSKLLKLLKNLSKEELDNISSRLQYSNTNSSLLFKYIVSFLHADVSLLEKEVVFPKIFPNQAFNENRMLKTMSELTKVLEQEIILSAQKKDIISSKTILLRFYLKNGLDNLFDIEYKETMLLVNKMPEHSILFFERYVLEELYIERMLKEKIRNSDYSKLNQYLEDFYAISSLRLKNLILVNLDDNIPNYQSNSKLLELFSKTKDLLEEKDTADFDMTFKLMVQNANIIHKDELRLISILLINYSIYQINQKKQIFKKLTFDLYQFQIENEILLEKSGCIAPSAFKNIVTLGLRLGEVNLVKVFVKQFKNFLPALQKEEICKYNNAYILFYENDFNESLMLLKSYSFQDVFYKIGAKRLQIMCFFSLLKNDDSWMEVLQNALNSFKKYIYTNKEISNHYKNNDIEFWKLTNKIANHFNNQSRLKNTLLDLEKKEQIAEFEWLKNYLQSLIGKKNMVSQF